MKTYEKFIVGTLATLTSISLSNPNLAEAKPNYENQAIAQAQKDPTFGEDLRRYGNKAKKTGGRFIKNIKERYTDHILLKADNCKRTHSKTENCQDAIKKARELNK
jgi:hypothetical protein